MLSGLVEAIGFGVASGAVLAIGAVGLTVQFGISGVFNLAYGSLLTVAAFTGYFLVEQGISFWLAMVLVAAGTGIVSVALNRAIYVPLRRRGATALTLIVATLYVATFIQYLVALIAGDQQVSFAAQAGRELQFLGFTLSQLQITFICISALLMLAFHLLLTTTKLGRALRATAGNRTLARACGIRTGQVVDFTWFITGMMCGVAGMSLAATTVAFDFNLGALFLFYMVAGLLLGGAGQPYGAMLGAMVIGISSQIAAYYVNPLFSDVVAFGIMVMILVLRPRGIFGQSGAASGLEA
jgi:branched-subunit amino acid ABC-type transport system permease component